MSKSKQLDVVRGLSEDKVNQLAGEVSGLAREKREAESMLERLTEYVDDYTLPTDQSPGGYRNPAAILNERRFVSKLTGALEQQRVHTDRVAERMSYKMNSWARAKADLEALDRLVERRSVQAQREQQRAEQRDNDAAASRAAQRATSIFDEPDGGGHPSI